MAGQSRNFNVFPNDDRDRILARRPTPPPATSWWTEPMTWMEFRERAAAELPRMRLSVFGQQDVVRPTGVLETCYLITSRMQH